MNVDWKPREIEGAFGISTQKMSPKTARHLFGKVDQNPLGASRSPLPPSPPDVLSLFVPYRIVKG